MLDAALVMSFYALELDLHLFHTVFDLGDLMLELIFVAVNHSYVVSSSLSNEMLNFIYDIAPLFVDLTSEVFERDARFNVCRHFSHGTFDIINISFLTHLNLKFLGAAFAFAINHSLREFELFN